jgi:hypothetical protein
MALSGTKIDQVWMDEVGTSRVWMDEASKVTFGNDWLTNFVPNKLNSDGFRDIDKKELSHWLRGEFEVHYDQKLKAEARDKEAAAIAAIAAAKELAEQERTAARLANPNWGRF